MKTNEKILVGILVVALVAVLAFVGGPRVLQDGQGQLNRFRLVETTTPSIDPCPGNEWRSIGDFESESFAQNPVEMFERIENAYQNNCQFAVIASTDEITGLHNNPNAVVRNFSCVSSTLYKKASAPANTTDTSLYHFYCYSVEGREFLSGNDPQTNDSLALKISLDTYRGNGVEVRAAVIGDSNNGTNDYNYYRILAKS